MHVLCFNLYSSMASWGDISSGGKRHTKRMPTKSAITGLLAAALGYKRDEEDKIKNLSDAFGFASFVHNAGLEHVDYHTVQAPKQKKGIKYQTRKEELSFYPEDVNTILSDRYYLSDHLVQIAVWLKDEASLLSLNDLKEHLKHPLFPLYIGRKAYVPALPLNPQIIEANTVIEAVKQQKVMWPFGEDKPSFWLVDRLFGKGSIAVYWEPVDHFGLEHTHQNQRRDLLLSSQKRHFGNRQEYFCLVDKSEEWRANVSL